MTPTFSQNLLNRHIFNLQTSESRREIVEASVNATLDVLEGRDRDRNRDRDRDDHIRGGGSSRRAPQERRIFVSNVPFEMKWQEVKDMFRDEIGADSKSTFVKLFRGKYQLFSN